MEKFPSREVAANTLKRRNNKLLSHTYWVTERERSSDQERGYFQEADRTGYMRVFLRYASDPVPSLLDTPDEEWILERGGKMGVVIRLPWMAGDETLSVRGDCLKVVPVPSVSTSDVPDYEVRKPTGVRPVARACPSCFIVPSVTGRCGCS